MCGIDAHNTSKSKLLQHRNLHVSHENQEEVIVAHTNHSWFTFLALEFDESYVTLFACFYCCSTHLIDPDANTVGIVLMIRYVAVNVEVTCDVLQILSLQQMKTCDFIRT